jgi:hypothetical protein
MKSAMLGKRISAEVSNVSTNGFWILIAGKERFVPFEDFPWFRDARIRELVNVELQSPDHLYWPDLDIDLAVDSIDHPERYPRVSRLRADTYEDSPRQESNISSALKKRTLRKSAKTKHR